LNELTQIYICYTIIENAKLSLAESGSRDEWMDG